MNYFYITLECMNDSHIKRLELAGTVTWEKRSFYGPKKCVF